MSERPRILLWDIESFAIRGYSWGLYDQRILAVDEDWFILSFAWKWLGDKRVNVLGLDDFDGYRKNKTSDKALMAKAHELMSEADIIVAHNGTSFDTKKVQTRLIANGFPPPKPFREVDTLRIAKRHFAFSSNRLGDLCKAMGIGAKGDPGGFETWLACRAGDPKAWARMKRYNKQDVVILEQLYLKLRPWSNNHPNMALLSDKPSACPKCGSTKGMVSRGWSAAGSVSRRRRYECLSCRGYSSGRIAKRSEVEYVA